MKPILLLLVLSILFGCQQTDSDAGMACTEIFVFGLSIIVRDANTDAILKDEITVTATDGNYSEELMTFPDTDNFFGAGERAGTYIVTIAGNGYQNFISQPIEVNEDACHVIPEEREYLLQPN